jgi:hypothetical protein
MDLVEVERKLARKAGNNARGVVGRDVFSVLHYSKAHLTKFGFIRESINYSYIKCVSE